MFRVVTHDEHVHAVVTNRWEHLQRRHAPEFGNRFGQPVVVATPYSLFIVGMRTTPAPIASVLVLLEPLTAAFLSWLLLGEQLGVFGIVGTVMLLIAIYLLSMKEARTPKEELTAAV